MAANRRSKDLSVKRQNGAARMLAANLQIGSASSKREGRILFWLQLSSFSHIDFYHAAVC